MNAQLQASVMFDALRAENPEWVLSRITERDVSALQQVIKKRLKINWKSRQKKYLDNYIFSLHKVIANRIM